MDIGSKVLKTIVLSEAQVLLNENSTDEKTVISYRVEVTTPETAFIESFPTQEEAQAYAAEIAQREPHPFDFGHILSQR